jgi:flagellar export protein FliJ
MRNPEALQRMHRWRLDEQRRKVAELERFKADIDARIERLGDEMTREQQTAGLTVEGQRAYPAYAAAGLQRRRTLAQSQADVAANIAAAREELGGLFREAKKYDIWLENRAKRERTAIARKLRAELDEIGIERHRQRSRAV